ncbi:hypothetical protein HK099_008408, partial [Clydaea vesicula]
MLKVNTEQETNGTLTRTIRSLNNEITKIENLPASFTSLDCNWNEITKIENLPDSLTQFSCASNQVTRIENLPDSLTELNFDENPVKNLDDVDISRLNFSLDDLSVFFTHYKAIKRIQKRIKR